MEHNTWMESSCILRAKVAIQSFRDMSGLKKKHVHVIRSLAEHECLLLLFLMAYRTTFYDDDITGSLFGAREREDGGTNGFLMSRKARSFIRFLRSFSLSPFISYQTNKSSWPFCRP